MAIGNKSLFLYGYQITEYNSSLDFVNVASGPVIKATLRLGFYSLSSLLVEIIRAMQAADPDTQYFATADRTYLAGLENRVTIATAGTYLDLLFASGPRAASSCATILGFNSIDRTGSLSYLGNFTSGTILITDFPPYQYLSPDFKRKVFGSANVSANGSKEAVVHSIQKFMQAGYQYEPYQKIVDEWVPLMEWMISQKLFDFTPDYTTPNTFYEVTLEQTDEDGQGLAYNITEMLPDFPGLYDCGTNKYRVNNA
jgi:hypothetical protein